jgi:predicted TIM-barrel fold metal-dependent hydrolase
VLWDPDSNELAVEAVRKYPERFAIMGWFYLDDPDRSALVARWKERPGMLGLRFYFNERHPLSWVTDGTLDWLWPAAEQAGVPLALAAALFLPTVGKIAERHPGLKLIVDHMGVPPGSRGESAYRFQPDLLALAKYPNVAVKATGQAGYAEDGYPFRSLHPHLHRCFDAFGPERDVLGHRHHPDAMLLAAMRDSVHRKTAVAEGTRSRSGHGRSRLQLAGLAPPCLDPGRRHP